MAFDLNTARPVGGGGGFDLSTARPAEEPPKDFMTSMREAARERLDALKGDPSAMTWFRETLGPNGNLRGSALGGIMQGMADPVAAGVQIGANLIPGAGEAINKGIANQEQRYQDARKLAGRDGFDAARLAGTLAETTLVSRMLGPAAPVAEGIVGKTLQGAKQGGIFAAANPVVDNSQPYWEQKGKDVALGAGVGAAAAPVVAGVARLISPKASTNADVAALKAEGIKPTAAQAMGGWVNSVEEKSMSLPIVGDAIRWARQRAEKQFNQAAVNRALKPIGETSTKTGHEAIAEMEQKIGDVYDKVLPKLSVDVTDPAFLSKIASLRQGVQSLPKDLRDYFDSVLSREIDSRIAPNGVLSGQNLKDAWRALRDLGGKLDRSQDPFQSQLGGAIKQMLEEIKTHVAKSNPAALVSDLKKADLAYANFKRLQRASASVAAESGNFTPAQLHNAVKAADKSKDKARFARNDALMQDLSGAGKRVLQTKYPDSGTAGRLAMNLATAGGVAAFGGVPGLAAMGGGASMYIPQVQNALLRAVSSRPDSAPMVANSLRDLLPYLSAVGGIAAAQ